jgi:copper chaperone CopZ
MRWFQKKSEGKRIELVVHDMHCGHCELTVKQALRKVPGVQSVKVSSRRKHAVVTVDPEQRVTPQDLIGAVEETGYRAHPVGMKET